MVVLTVKALKSRWRCSPCESGVYEEPSPFTIPLVDYISLSCWSSGWRMFSAPGKTGESYSGNGIKSAASADERRLWLLFGKNRRINLPLNKQCVCIGQSDDQLWCRRERSNEPKMTGGTVSIYLNDQEVITKTLGEKEETQEDAQQAALVEKSGRSLQGME